MAVPKVAEAGDQPVLRAFARESRGWQLRKGLFERDPCCIRLAPQGGSQRNAGMKALTGAKVPHQASPLLVEPRRLEGDCGWRAALFHRHDGHRPTIDRGLAIGKRDTI